MIVLLYNFNLQIPDQVGDDAVLPGAAACQSCRGRRPGGPAGGGGMSVLPGGGGSMSGQPLSVIAGLTGNP